jgi:predicted nucleic acid-binding protein
VFLVTGDKSALLALKTQGATAILTAKELLDRLD